MINQERQMNLDDEKWFASQKAGEDKAGSMDWCNYCSYQTKKSTCGYTKTKGTPCATAYNKMRKARDKEIAAMHGVK